jgi:hypothetical protein
VEPNLVQPTFVTEYPIEISPLAKKTAGDPTTVERFEYFFAGMEMGNAFTELNDPVDQRARMEWMQQLYGAEDEERHPVDEDYLLAMSYGMPPTAASAPAWTGWRCSSATRPPSAMCCSSRTCAAWSAANKAKNDHGKAGRRSVARPFFVAPG